MRGRVSNGASGIALGVAAAAVVAGCDPIIDVAGANFPAWLVCAIAGVILAVAMRQLFAAAGIERYLRPLALVYVCLVVLISCVLWVIFFNRV